jgi:drug/metabolite transporter superfamily protein YnfA
MTGMLIGYLAGAVTLGYLIAGAFFLRFWRRTGDRLFMAFAAAFGLLSLNQLLATLLDAANEGTVYAYALRVLGFLLILWAIIDKNLTTNRG